LDAGPFRRTAKGNRHPQRNGRRTPAPDPPIYYRKYFVVAAGWRRGPGTGLSLPGPAPAGQKPLAASATGQTRWLGHALHPCSLGPDRRALWASARVSEFAHMALE